MKNIIAKAEIKIEATIEKVWDALTNPEIIKEYFFGTYVHSTWQPGSPITFTGEWEGKKYEDKGTILKAEPPTLLQYNYWSSMSGIEDKPENYVVITYDLQERNNLIDVTITQQNIPTEEMREHSEQNWKVVLEGLKKVVER
jgi:uncharacterized protein YndB with AHSA1/START domain